MIELKRKVLATSLLLALLAGCSFDDEKLTLRECGPTRGCSGELEVCCQGYCVLAATCGGDGGQVPDQKPVDLAPDFDPLVDRDKDGVANDVDNCPDTFNPSQLDQDQDGAGNECDCAPTDKALVSAVLDLKSFTIDHGLISVDSASWSLIGSVLHQPEKDGMQRARKELQDQKDFVATTTFRLRKRGEDQLTTLPAPTPPDPETQLSMAGVMVRTSNLGTIRGDGYYCGVDLQNFRLFIAKTTGQDLPQKQIVLLAEPFSKPGKLLGRPVVLDTPYTVTLRAVGTLLTCTVVLPDQSQIEQTITDADITAGAFALFTIGASADFEMVKVCAKP
jgi:hypothetical protein